MESSCSARGPWKCRCFIVGPMASLSEYLLERAEDLNRRGWIMAAQATPERVASQTPKGAWRITFLLFLFMLVNFADKIVVGLAGVPIMTELNLEPEQFGLLGSSFFFLFFISAIVVG